MTLKMGCPVLCEGEEGYDAARRVWNGMIDRKPRWIVRPRNIADVMHAPRASRARASGVLLHGTGTGTAAGTGTETADELTRVNNHRPSIFLASPSRSTWLTAVQNGKPVAGFNATLK
jgi:hypothetical protein